MNMTIYIPGEFKLAEDSGATEVTGDNGLVNGLDYFYGEGNSSSIAKDTIGTFVKQIQQDIH